MSNSRDLWDKPEMALRFLETIGLRPILNQGASEIFHAIDPAKSALVRQGGTQKKYRRLLEELNDDNNNRDLGVGA